MHCNKLTNQSKLFGIKNFQLKDVIEKHKENEISRKKVIKLDGK